MQILSVDMTPLLNGREKELFFDLEWDHIPEIFSGIVPIEPVSVSGTISDRHSYYEMQIAVGVAFEAECSRCLKSLKKTETYRSVRKLAASENEGGEECVIIDGNTVTLNETAEEILFLELPSRVLCDENCKGLCDRCGKNLNEGPCECGKEIDPRWAGLEKFLDET